MSCNLPDYQRRHVDVTVGHRHEAEILFRAAHAGTPEMAKAALELGAYRVVSKPFAVQELAALVSEAHAAR